MVKRLGAVVVAVGNGKYARLREKFEKTAGETTVDVVIGKSVSLPEKMKKTAGGATVDVGIRRSARLREKFEKTARDAASKGNNGSHGNGRKTVEPPKRRASSKKSQPKKKPKLSAGLNPVSESQDNELPEPDAMSNDLSQLPLDGNWKNRNNGLWIECCRENCGKWRYNGEIDDPLDVPEIWYCDMNPDRSVASCDYPQEEFPNYMIENKYTAGSIVWARLDGYPWWPAMVVVCPYTLRYYELKNKSNVPVKYNVVFFEEDKAQISWIPVANIKPYKNNPKKVFLYRKRMKFRGVSYRDQVDRACELADRAVRLSIHERLEEYSFENATRNRTNQLCSQRSAVSFVSRTLTPSSAAGSSGIGGISQASSSQEIPIAMPITAPINIDCDSAVAMDEDDDVVILYDSQHSQLSSASIERARMNSSGNYSRTSGSSRKFAADESNSATKPIRPYTEKEWNSILKPLENWQKKRKLLLPRVAGEMWSNEEDDISHVAWDNMDFDQRLRYLYNRGKKLT